ncbi:adenylosuccinate lyase [Longilinea arvoryzae]|uniref:Adenylosuccinate lyase n=1 Tax=Longilinea arvoryzae TaxID=360412 RepID=A0A0S7BGJ6_9CHLR|nr:adenylosuccinate lyase [Longilinea arvoryzae]GAP12929.1 adenylosuccinate lyase [Longilinea arvoryzae]
MPDDFDGYLSPFSWRYASPEMRSIWSERNKRLLWRRIWLALARVQSGYGLVSADQLADIEAHAAEIDIPRALEIEAEIRHDLMAELKTFAEQAPLGGGALHLGATSMDVEDNADALRLRDALDLILVRLNELLSVLAEKIDAYAGTPVMAFTHLQPAEPSTLGYRLASYAQDLLEDGLALRSARDGVRGKGFKGAVGTAAAYGDLLGLEAVPEFERRLSEALGLPFYSIATQTYPRKQDYTVLAALAGMGASLYKLAFDLRVLQSPPIGEVSEPFGRKQVGSSAMPFKRNPINAEKIDSLARSLSVMPQVAWGNAAHSLLERTLDDSANRRSLLPEAFLTADELLGTATKILRGLVVREETIRRNLAIYAPFAATERVMMAAARHGADRQEMHERLREHALAAWAVVQNGSANDLIARLQADAGITRFVPPAEIAALADVQSYVGTAPDRARAMAGKIKEEMSNRPVLSK